MKERVCRYCGGKEFKEIERPDTQHKIELRCVSCGKFWGWKGLNNKNQRKNSSRYSLRDVVEYHNLPFPFCFFCLRKEDELPPSQTLTRDHILELNLGGKDDLSNIQILCTACHKLKNWARLYHNFHWRGVMDADTKTITK